MASADSTPRPPTDAQAAVSLAYKPLERPQRGGALMAIRRITVNGCKGYRL